MKKSIEKIQTIVENHFDDQKDDEFVPGKDKVNLNAPSYGAEEVVEAIRCLLSTWVTMGDRVFEFERLFAEYLSAEKALMVNSGSSANLVALKSLKQSGEITEGDEVIVPACTWSTSVSPILDIGGVPVFVDSNPRTLNPSIESIEKNITKDTAAIMAVHLLGNPADIVSLRDICDKHDLLLVEDCCESHGATVDGEYIGTFGEYGTYSFFFSHHISTIEGGMLVSKNSRRVENAKPIRAHGWIREMEDKREIADKYDGFDERYLFVESGLNVRPTEIQGAFGVHQMDKLEDFISIRRKNADRLLEELGKYSDLFDFQEEHPKGRHTWFGFPLIVRDEAPFERIDITRYLENSNIETRPIMGGNLSAHPAFSHLKNNSEDLEVANRIHRNGFFFGNHHKIGPEKTEYIVETIESFVNNYS